jgi:alpha-glucosidase (family GH31 glycosyl hydrolase)
MTFQTTSSEGFYGFGQRWNAANQRGKRLQCWLEEASWSFLNLSHPLPAIDGESSTYMPMPFFISSNGYGIEVDTSYRTEFDMAYSRNDQFTIRADHNAIDVIFYLGRTPAETLSLFTKRRGLTLIPPPWMFGMWKQLEYTDNNCTLLDCAQKMIDHDIPFSVQQGYVHFFPAGSQIGQETKLRKNNEALHRMGIKSTTYFNPYVR